MSDDKSGGGKPGFTVNDRRSFAEAAEERPPAAAPAPVAPSVGAAVARESEEEEESAEAAARLAAAFDAPVDFHTFILSLGSSALLHLGELDHPDGEPSIPDLPMAKHTIDIIAMLEQKTKGNLSPPEARLIESLLFDLRLRYVERSKAARP